jgi:hypothetical protein
LREALQKVLREVLQKVLREVLQKVLREVLQYFANMSMCSMQVATCCEVEEDLRQCQPVCRDKSVYSECYLLPLALCQAQLHANLANHCLMEPW